MAQQKVSQASREVIMTLFRNYLLEFEFNLINMYMNFVNIIFHNNSMKLLDFYWDFVYTIKTEPFKVFSSSKIFLFPFLSFVSKKTFENLAFFAKINFAKFSKNPKTLFALSDLKDLRSYKFFRFAQYLKEFYPEYVIDRLKDNIMESINYKIHQKASNTL